MQGDAKDEIAAHKCLGTTPDDFPSATYSVNEKTPTPISPSSGKDQPAFAIECTHSSENEGKLSVNFPAKTSQEDAIKKTLKKEIL